MRIRAALLLLPLLLLLACRAQPPECYDVPAGQASSALPLCGNGVLDPGEVCDDGNNINWDGCNAFCSAFDAMSAAATLAGGTLPCPSSRHGPVLGGATGQARFCNLRAVDSGPDGSYVILADGGTLLRFDLFTDALINSIYPLQASIDRTFQDVCSLAVLAPDASIAFHDCGAQQLFVSMADGSHVQMVADWSAVFQSTRNSNNKAYYNKATRQVVVAGTLLPASSLIGVQMVNISAFEDFYASASTPPVMLATIPQTIYNVWEGASKILSFDVSGMEPRAVLLEPCPATFRSLQLCYVVYMERPAHMEFLRAYIPESGGLDIEYYSLTTASLMDNALGHPLVRYSGSSLKYTLTGACFQIESQLVTSDGKSPPVITLGNACKRAPRLGVDCATPLNNPFITDVMTSPILLPDGLSSTHTHSELSEIFASSCQNQSAEGGPLLYRSILTSVYANTTPVDFAELTGVLDVVYVTPTSVGLISTKRILFRDRTQAGYARATNLIYCPPSYFGQVGGVCTPCQQGGASVAWQIQCTPNSIFETFTLIASKNVSEEHVQQGICLYASAKGGQCSSSTTLSPQQPYNMAADALDAQLAGVRIPQTQQSLVRCLIASAEARTGMTTLFRPHEAEYNMRVVSQGHYILSAASNRGFNISNAQQQQCRGSIAKGLGSFLQCSVPDSTAVATTSARRLLQQQPQVMLVEHQAASQASSTSIMWNSPTLAAPPSSQQQHQTAATPPPSASGDGGMPLWSIVLIAGLSSCVAFALILCFVWRRRLWFFSSGGDAMRRIKRR